ncbi:MAG: RsmD family RNA methyltransferase [Treponema sp.]
MRVTGGSLKNRIVQCPKGVIRPAMDRMRLSLFSILGNIAGLSFLDLFTGSGICALEAASRGADPVVAVEKDVIKFGTLLDNVSIAENKIMCHRMAVELFIKRNSYAFDIIYIDPPFPYKFHAELLGNISNSQTAKEGSMILMHRPKEKPNDEIEGLVKIDERHYGRSIVDFYKKT